MPSPTYTPFGVAVAIGVPAADNKTAKFGDASDSGIVYDGTNLVIDPDMVGSGVVDIDGGCLVEGHLAVGNSASVNSARLLSLEESGGNASNGLYLNMTYTGATAAMRSQNFTAIHSGSAGSPSVVGGLFTADHTVNPSGTVTVIGVQATGNVGAQATQGTRIYEGLRASITDGGAGAPTTSTLRVYGINQIVLPTLAAGAGATVTKWGAMFNNDVQIIQNVPLILDGTATTKGDTTLKYDSSVSQLQFQVDGTKVLYLSSKILPQVDTQVNDNIRFTMGTGGDVSISYTGTVWDFNIGLATTEIVFNNAGLDTDLRMESDTDTDMFFLNAGTNRVGISTNAPTKTLGVDGDFALETAGNGIYIKEGTNATMGVATLVAGTLVVNTTKVTANSRIFLTHQTNAGTVGFVSVSARTAGTSFTILSSSALDTSVIAWHILEPA